MPTAPKNGQLVLKADDMLKFECDPSYVFPDTILRSRTLYCTDRNTWDTSLPDCVGMCSDYRCADNHDNIYGAAAAPTIALYQFHLSLSLHI